ncbi:MAG: hypothetical protein LC775_01200 [Acidobacteria bacterium]|nr:hypothetical protein [Acidobacteriota bacterium]
MRRGTGTGHLLSMLHQAVVSPPRPNPVVLTWRWRYEMALLTGLPLALVALVEAIGPTWAMLIATAVTTILTGWSPARRQLAARAWCIITPHRLRTGCAQAFIYTRRGQLPTVLWCAPKSYGEQILLWCPAGIIANDFVAAHQILATACYASDLTIITHPKYQHLVMLGVIRYQLR